MPPRRAGSRTKRSPTGRREGTRCGDAFPWLLTTAVVLAAVVRIAFFLQLRGTPFFAMHISDAKIYMEIAASVGSGAPHPASSFMSPLYPLFIAGIASIFGNAVFWVRLIQCVLGTVAVMLTGLLGKRLWDRAAGLSAAFLLALSPEAVFFDNMILVESFLVFSSALYLFFAERSSGEGGILGGLGAGAALGLAVVTRFSLALVVPAALAERLRFRGKRGIADPRFAAMIAAAVLCVVPFMVRNALSGGSAVSVTSSGGFNYYAGNNSACEGWYRVPEEVDISRDPNGMRYASRDAGRELTPAETSAHWFGKAWAWMKEHPLDWLLLQARKLLLFFHPGEIDQFGLTPSFFRHEYGTVLSLPLPAWPVLLFLAWMGLAAMVRDRAPSGPVLPFAAAVIVSTVVFFVNGRLRMPVYPALALLGGYGVRVGIEAVRERSLRRAAALAGGAAFAAVSLAFQPAIPDRHERPYQALGDFAFRAGNYADAERFFSASLAEVPTSEAYMGKGNALAAQGRFEEASLRYDSALALNPRNALAWFNAGNLALQRGDAAVALRAWERSISLDPERSAPWRNRGLLLARLGRIAEAVSSLEQAVELETDIAVRKSLRRDIDALRRAAQPREP
ncbi:MAG: tetratricopeptide repeat protein [Bacteroidota bacterium]|nr:tetratricopeptide repeat protein [Bacteroidota bacterium]